MLDKEPTGSLDDVLTLMGDGGYTDVTSNVAFDTPRTPNEKRPTLVLATVQVLSTGGSEASVTVDVDGATRAEFSATATAGALTSAPDFQQTETTTFLVPSGASYTVSNSADPGGSNSITRVQEVTL